VAAGIHQLCGARVAQPVGRHLHPGSFAGAYFLVWRDERREGWDLYEKPVL
jgi:hypothetical protein